MKAISNIQNYERSSTRSGIVKCIKSNTSISNFPVIVLEIKNPEMFHADESKMIVHFISIHHKCLEN